MTSAFDRKEVAAALSEGYREVVAASKTLTDNRERLRPCLELYGFTVRGECVVLARLFASPGDLVPLECLSETFRKAAISMISAGVAPQPHDFAPFADVRRLREDSNALAYKACALDRLINIWGS